jgi:predicted signal transduction protein with EAL and GGDEF domain
VASTPALTGASVTASIGVAVFLLNSPSLDDAVRAADLAMYQAKAEGGNRVVALSRTDRIAVAARGPEPTSLVNWAADPGGPLPVVRA